MPSMEYLLGEIIVDGPTRRDEAIRANNLRSNDQLQWPEGWWAVSDDQFAYLAFFQFEADAWAYPLYLINLRMNTRAGSDRYKSEDKRISAKERARINAEEHAHGVCNEQICPQCKAFVKEETP